MKVTWEDIEVELDVEGNPLHATVASLIAEHAEADEFRGHLDSTAQTTMVNRAKMYADGKRDGLRAAIKAVLGAVSEVPVH